MQECVAATVAGPGVPLCTELQSRQGTALQGSGGY